MNTNKESVAPHEHYNSRYYQETVRLERGGENGMTSEQVYEKESAFALRVAGLDDPSAFEEGEGILDLACGAGNHTLTMNRLLKGRVSIKGVDLSDELLKLAERKKCDEGRQNVHNKVEFTLGDMAGIKKEVLNGQRYRLITVLGSSFSYLNIRQTREALHNYYDLLEPGGKIVLQFRQRPLQMTEAQKQHFARKVNKGRDDLKMKKEEVERGGERVDFYSDMQKGDAFYHVDEDCPHPDPQHPEDYEQTTLTNRNGKKLRSYREKHTGIVFEAFKRVYIDEKGTAHTLPPTVVNSFTWQQYFDKASSVMLKEAGFADVELKEPENDQDYIGDRRLMAIVGRKPTEHEVQVERTKEFWSDKL